MEKDICPLVILMADDDPDDCLLIKDAFRENNSNNELHIVGDGEALLDYLHHRWPYRDQREFPRPDLILLDLNMPRKDGREALEEIKKDPDLRAIPIVVLTTSQEKADVLRSYELGASSFIVKPVNFAAMVDMVKFFERYWFQISELPKLRPGEAGASGLGSPRSREKNQIFLPSPF